MRGTVDKLRPKGHERQYRADIQGLRAVAVLLVVLNHAGVQLFSGGYVGVDVFFVLSGFLITGLLLKDKAQLGRIRILDFYSRRARRILPAAALTLIATDIAAWSFLNYVRAQAAIQDSIWAAFFAANIEFQRLSTDYFANSQTHSPVLHFWSLAVEEQFYLVWPALLAALLSIPALYSRLHRNRAPRDAVQDYPKRAPNSGAILGRFGLLIVLLALTALVGSSLVWCIGETRLSANTAYFSPFARAWELGVGAMLAVGAPLLSRVPGPVMASLGWAGLVGIVTASITFTDSTVFPGSAALLPVLSTALVIVGGTKPVTAYGADRVLGLRPFRFVGDVSYSFYLWHWPFLIVAAGYEVVPLSTEVKLSLISAAFATAVATFFLFEDPLRRSERWTVKPESALALWPISVSAVVLVSVIALTNIGSVQSEAGPAVSPTASPFAMMDPTSAQFRSIGSVEADVSTAVTAAQQSSPLPFPLSPTVAQVPDDYLNVPGCIIREDARARNDICPMGDVQSSTTIVVFGDSKAEMYMPALIPVARQNAWKLIPLIKVGCTPPTWDRDNTNPVCRDWYLWSVSQILTIHPYLVIIADEDGYLSGDQARWERDIRMAIEALNRSGARIVLMGDVPGLPEEPVDCLLKPGANMGTCTFALPSARTARNAQAASVARTMGIKYVDVEPYLCAFNLCPTVIGRNIAYRNRNHISQTYASQLAGPFASALGPA